MLNQLAILLRGARDDIKHNIAPSLGAGIATERLEYIRQLLDLVAAEIDLANVVAPNVRVRCDEIADHAARYFGVAPAPVRGVTSGPPYEVRQIRAKLAALVWPLAKISIATKEQSELAEELLGKILHTDAEWRTALEQARNAKSNSAIEGRGRSSVIDPAALASLLNRRFLPETPIEVKEIKFLPGGRSKDTFIISLAPNAVLPERVVIRQDVDACSVDTIKGATTVSDEFPVLKELAQLKYPIPKPLLLEPDNNVIGRSFLLFEHCPGRTQGSWFGFTEPSRSVVADLAACLAKLHSISPAALGFSEEMEMSTEAIMAREIKFRWEKWCRDAVEASPIIEYAFAWLEKECRHGLGVPAVIHGDAGPHNLLIDDGRISAILDWELVHVGDPAEDLAYARTAIEAQIPWNEFLDIYYQNGGRPVDERRLKIFSIYGLVRNASFSATAAASFTKGESDDFMLGAVGIVPIPKIETLLIHLLIN